MTKLCHGCGECPLPEPCWCKQMTEDERAVIDAARDWKTCLDSGTMFPLAEAALYAAVRALEAKP